MSPLPPSEPSKIIEKIESLNSKKISFEVNKLELPIGIQGTFGTIRHPGAALAVPIKSDGKIIILRQYRFAVSRRILEFPAGTLEKEESPLTSIKRELKEESGYEASRWDPLGTMLPCPGYSDEVIHMFLAQDLSPIKNPPPGDDDEDLEDRVVDLEDALDDLKAEFDDMMNDKDGDDDAGDDDAEMP